MRGGPFFPAGGIRNWDSRYGNGFSFLLKTLKTELSRNQAPRPIHRRTLQLTTGKLAHHVIVALFTTARKWNQPKCPSVGERIQKIWNMHTVESYSGTHEH